MSLIPASLKILSGVLILASGTITSEAITANTVDKHQEILPQLIASERLETLIVSGFGPDQSSAVKNAAANALRRWLAHF